MDLKITQPKPNTKQAMIAIETPMGGMISDYWGYPSNALQGRQNQYTVAGGTSIFRKEKIGHIAPVEVFNSGSIADTSSYINSLPRAVAVDVSVSGGNYYFMLGGLSGIAPRIVYGTPSGGITTKRDITAGLGNNFTTIGTTGYWGEDIIFYTGSQSSTQIPMIFYSWKDSGTGHVGMASLSAGTPTFVSDDFLSTTYFTGIDNPKGGVPIRLCEGPDKILYFTNGQYIGSYDGQATATYTNGIYNPYALNLGVGWVAVDICKYQNYIAIAAVKTGTGYTTNTIKSESRVILWDGASLDFNYMYDADDYRITALSNQDFLYAFTQGRNGTTKVKYLPIAYGVSKLATLYESSTSIISTSPDPRSVDLYNGNLVWGNGSISTRYPINALVFGQNGGVHQPYDANNGTNEATSIGLLSNIDSDRLYIGGNFSGTYGIYYLDGSGGYLTSSFFRSGLMELPYRSTIDKIKVYFSQFTTDSSVIMSLYGSQTSSTDLLNYTTSSLTHPEAITFKACTLRMGSIADISDFWISMLFNHSTISKNAAIIRRIEIYYSIVDKP